MKNSIARRIAAASFVLSIAGVSPAFAHAALTGTSPSEGADATDITEVSLTANEDLLDLDGGKGFVFAVTDADGHFYGDGCVVVDDATASMPVSLGEAGKYTVAYRVVSADGHPIEGNWTFTYAPAADAAMGDAFAELPVCGSEQQPITTPTPTPEITANGDVDGEELVDEEDDGEIDVAPIIGLASIPVVIGSIWLLMRSLGKRDSEDHLN